MFYQDSIEIDELRHPIFVHARRLIPDSEGAGRFRGALGAYSEFSPVDCAMTVAYVSDGNVNPAAGTRGGLSGARSAQFRRHADGSLEAVPACAEVLIGAEQAMGSISGGGGGYGHPHERDPARVVHDVREGSVSRERAEQVYGVVLTDALTLDVQRTALARSVETGRPSPL
eukprot:gene27637-30603_t